MSENDKQAAQGKDILPPPHPRHFGIPAEHWERAKNYAEYLAQNKQADPVAWRPILQHPIPWVTGKPQESDIRHWASQGCEIQYAFTHPAPAAAINEQLLEALKLADAALEGAHMNADVVYKKVKAAIAAVEAEKAKGGAA